jgi:hypothetical protein
MLKIENLKKQIIEQLEELRQHASHSNKMGQFDHNQNAEEFYRGLLNLFFDWDLKNLNTVKDPNYEGADLGDIKKGIAVQVTSENNSEKVHDSIKGFKNKLFKKDYKELYILIFTGKKNFPRVDFNKTVDRAFNFDKTKHIIDHSDLVSKLRDAEFKYVKRIYDYLDEQIKKLSDYNLDEAFDDLGIISEIFDYIQENKPKKLTDIDTIISSSETNLTLKIKLNFYKKQQEHIERLIKKNWDKKNIVGDFVQKQIQEDEISINELIFQIQEDFCGLRGSNSAYAKIEDIAIIKNLSREYLPERKKRNPSYIANAEALIFYFFEFCYIGNRTEKEKPKNQKILFDWD